MIAFERLAEELHDFGAPAQLVERARAAAADEVRHAASMTRLARQAGAEPQTLHVQDMRGRDLLDFALENAVEGCVRETFGVVDAAYRGRHAPTPELRRVFAQIATDELRHAQLSWDIAAWVWGRLATHEQLQVATAMSVARAELEAELQRGVAPEICARLGAPDVPVALQLARSVAEQVPIPVG